MNELHMGVEKARKFFMWYHRKNGQNLLLNSSSNFLEFRFFPDGKATILLIEELEKRNNFPYKTQCEEERHFHFKNDPKNYFNHLLNYSKISIEYIVPISYYLIHYPMISSINIDRIEMSEFV